MPVEAPNTLRSRARYKIIDILGQGPMVGLVNGAQSVFLNETPVQAADGTLNFTNFDISKDLQELPIEDVDGKIVKYNPSLFPLSENEVSVGVKVTKDSPEGSGSGDGSVTRTITDTNVDSVRVTVRVPALTTTDTTTGDITGGVIQWQISVKPDGGSFQPVQSGMRWQDLAAHDSETSSSATGIRYTAQVTRSSLINATLRWQYRKKTAGVWGSWITYRTRYFAAASSSAYGTGYFTQPTQEYLSASIDGLAPGIYQAQLVSSGATIANQSAAELAETGLTISGKTVSPYDADYIVQLPGDGPWDIKVSRISADPATANIQADLYWLSYTEQISNRFSWPNTSGVAITFDAEDFGGEIPARSYDVMGLKVKIPANYDPYARTYTGVWNGTFIEDWTDNPAWIFYDLLTNKRYGLGDNIDAAQIDKYALYQIAQYCDELVDAPNGEQEARYTCSCVINSQSEAYELLTAIASAFRGMIYLSGGTITPTADMPADPILNVGPANVIDGIFTYQGASRKARHTVARVSWNNPDDGYKLNVELYEDTEAIRKYGYRPVDINAFGCTSRGLARRWGKWAITSDNDAPDTVTYKAGFDHFKLRPGNVINIADPNYSGEQLFGLIVSVTDNVSPATHTIKLDRAATRVAGDTSELQVTLADGTILLLDVAVVGSDVTSDEITVDSVDLTDTPLAGASWLLKKGTVEPRQWRVISISEDEPNIYQVTAMLYDPNKYDKVESDLNFAEADFTAFPTGEMPAPTGLAISEFLKQTGSAILACVNLSWTRPNDPRADWFEVQYQLDGEEWRVTEPNITQFTGIDILNIVPGTYNFRVRAQDTSGLFRSSWTTLSSQTLLGKDKKPEDVTDFTAVIEKYGVLLNWSPVSDIDLKYYEIRRGADWATGTFVGRTAGTVFKWEDATEAAYTFWIKAIDTNFNESENATDAAATVEVEATPTVVGATVKGGIAVTISGVTTSRFAHYELQRKESTEVDGDAVTVNALLASRTFTDTLVGTIGYTPLYQYRARAYNKNLNASAWSAWSTGVNPGQITATDLIDGALNRSELFQAGVVDAAAIAAAALKSAGLAAGAWSAQNCTTASIAEVGGVIDISGQGNHGQAVGGVAVVADDIGSCFSLDTTKHLVASGASLTAANRTFSIWYKKTGAGNAYAQILAQNSSSGGGGGLNINGLWLNSAGAIVGYATDGTSVRHTTGPTPTTGEWYHIALVMQGGSNLLLYINGVLYSSSTLAFNPRGNGLDVYVGGYALAVAFRAFAPRIYDRALSATEIKSLYMFPGDVAFARITADYVAALAITAEKIASEAVTTAKLAAGAVTTEKLLIGKAGAALNQDPNFADSSAWSTVTGSPSYVATTTGKVGTTIVRATNARALVRTTKSIPIDPAKTYRVRAWVRSSAASVNAKIQLYRYAANDSPISTTATASTTIPGTGAWTEIYAIYTPGAADNYILFGIDLNSGGVAATLVDAQDCRIEECLPATLIQDGAIVTDKLAAGAITAGKISAGAIETAALAANAVTADKILAGAIEAEKINVTAFKVPLAATASWNAKGSTTSSIAIANGVKDISGNGYNGTGYGGVLVADSIVGKSFRFTSSAHYIDITSLPVLSTKISLSAWLYTTSVDAQQVMARSASGKREFSFRIDNQAPALWLSSSGASGDLNFNSSSSLAGGFNHVVITITATKVSFFINGSLTDEWTGDYTRFTGDALVRIGRWAEGTILPFSGYIAHPQIFNSALTATEVKTLYMLGSDSESGTITADRVVTGELKSLNYSTTAGSMIDLDDGTFKFGGSSAPKLSWNGTTLAVSGNLTGSTGEIGGLDILDAGIGSDGSELISSKYSGIIMFAEANNGIGTIFDTGSSCFLSTSWTSGPILNSSVRIAATGYYDGSTTDKAHIKIIAESAADYAIDTNGKIQGDTIDISDERLKGGIQAASTLDKLKTLSVTEWHYDDEKIRQKIREEEIATALREGRGLKVRKVYSPDIDYKPIERHIGPMAADFNRLFGVSNGSETGINLSDGIGVALRAIQELAEIVDDLKAENAELRAALKLPEKQKKQANAADFTAEEIERVADGYVKAAYDNIMQDVKGKKK